MQAACRLIQSKLIVLPLLQVLPETLATKAEELQELIIAVVAGTLSMLQITAGKGH
jgi:hypothetical protein